MVPRMKSLAQVQMTFFNLLILIQTSSNLAEEAQNFGEKRPFSHEVVLSWAEPWVLSQMLGDICPDKFFHHLAPNRREADRPEVFYCIFGSALCVSTTTATVFYFASDFIALELRSHRIIGNAGYWPGQTYQTRPVVHHYRLPRLAGL